jgi:hypothetical protein
MIIITTARRATHALAMRGTRVMVSTVVALVTLAHVGAHAQAPRFEIVVPASVRAEQVTGRLLLVLSRDSQPEPRFTVSPQGPALFGIDVEQLTPGQPAILDDGAIGYPVALPELPAGEYWAQAVINVYERVQRSDGHALWLPMTDGTIVSFAGKPGNLYSTPQQVRVGAGGTVRIEMSHVVPPARRPADTDWVKRVRIRSEKLTRFWGRPIYIHATVLLPRGYNDRSDVRYPTVYALGHSIPFGFNPDSTRVRNIGRINPVTGLESGYDFYRAWTADDFPRVIAVTLQQSTPYFPDSYSVNSASNGPYGDAIVEEVIPYLEREFRMIDQPYARILEGASTSGWQTLALLLRNADFFGGAWVLQPDPIDFRNYLLTDIYEDENAFTSRRGSLVVERPFRRTVEGQVVWTMRQLSRFEAVLGSRGRSGFQLTGWDAVYGPIDEDGYPRPLWDKLTGVIDRDVANYMRDNGYDLRAYAERHWQTIGPKLAGKLHFFAGEMDDFYLNLAVYRFEEFAKSTTNPRSDATFTWGRPMKGHSWHDWTWAEMVRNMADHIRAHAPAGENVESWRH